MAEEGRALMTEREREIIAGEADVTDNYRYKVQSLVRNRVRKKFGDDVDVLEEHFQEVYEMVLRDVCSDAANDQELADIVEDLEVAYQEIDRDGIEVAIEQLKVIVEETE